MNNFEKGALRRLWAGNAPWYGKVMRTGAIVMAGLVVMPAILENLPGEPAPAARLAPLQEFYRAAVDTSAIKIHASPPADLFLRLTGSVAVAVGKTVIVSRQDRDLLGQPAAERDFFLEYVLAHEFAHVMQHNEAGLFLHWRVLYEKLAAQVGGKGLNGLYEYSLQEGKPLTAYGIEQQASILADYYAVQNGMPPLLLFDKLSREDRDRLYRNVLADFLKKREAAPPVKTEPALFPAV